MDLVELDSVEIVVIVDNELDPISPTANEAVGQTGGLATIGMTALPTLTDRGDAKRELRMDGICCGAHGLSLMITGVAGDQRRTMMFDAGPEAHVWERNANRLKADIKLIERIQLSHWHRDHSGGMIKAIEMINAAKRHHSQPINSPVTVDLHPNRPDARGVMVDSPISLELDPTFDEFASAGAKVEKSDAPHAVLDGYFGISGEIPRVTEYETGLKRGVRYIKEKNIWEEDTMIKDERFLMCKLKGKGIVLFTGCSHAGAVNAAKHSLTLTDNATPLYAVMGGYHLADALPEQIQATAQDLKDLDVKLLMTGHCTGWRAKFAIQQMMPGRLVPSFVGSRFVL